MQLEIYFLEDGDDGPFSPRNEIESHNSILSAINLSLDSYSCVAADPLQFLKETALGLISKIGALYSDYPISDESNSDAELLLIKWGEELGVKTNLLIRRKIIVMIRVFST